MTQPSLVTVQLNDCVERWQAGDATAADELFRACGDRLEHLARRMLKGFPNLRGWVDTGDVFQGAACRLLHALQKLNPPSTRDFFNLAASLIRRELIDLARRYCGKLRPAGADGASEPSAAESLGPAELELWSRFHEAVEELPLEEREVFSLVLYHGWKQPEIAVLFGVNPRTIRRRWNSSCIHLTRLLGGQLPPL